MYLKMCFSSHLFNSEKGKKKNEKHKSISGLLSSKSSGQYLTDEVFIVYSNTLATTSFFMFQADSVGLVIRNYFAFLSTMYFFT